MAAPSYTEDLTDVDLAESATGWAEFTGNSYNSQGSPAGGDADYPFIQGSYSVTQDCTKDTSIGSLGYDIGTGATLPTDGAFLVWQNFSSAGNIANYANGGFRVVIGSSLSDFRAYYVGGVDKGTYPYGGWQNHAANPTLTADDTAGTPTTTYQYIGAAVNVTTGPKKGETHQVDVIRYGRCSSIFEFGDLGNGYCTFAGFAAVNDTTANRWGLIQETAGGYLWKGRMSLGTSTNPVDFRDTNKNVFIQWTPKVTPKFNTIEIINASSNVAMTGITFQVLDTTTASRGKWLTTNDATVTLDGCTFLDMDTFSFDSNTTIDGCTFRRCEILYQNGCSFDACTFSNMTSAIGILCDDITNISNCIFVSDGTGHAIELTSAHIQGGEYTFTGNTFTGYASTSGSTGNEAIYNNSGNLITINVAGGDTPSIRNGTGSFTIVNNTVTLTLTGIVANSEVRIYSHGTINELAGIENVDTLDDSGITYKFVYAYNYSASTYVDIVIHNVQYEYYRIDNLLLASENGSIPIDQQFDRNYDNP
jgi:hypothetical protein